MNILITAIGSMSAACVISELRADSHLVVGCDIYPPEWHAESQLCDYVYQAPLASDQETYIDFLLKTAKSHQISYLIPLTDLEIDVINSYRDLFTAHNIILCMPAVDTIQIARNKFNLYNKFKFDSNVPSIKTYLCPTDAVDKSSLPYIAKPFNGRSSEGLMRIYTENELNLIRQTPGYILQEYKEGSIFTVDYVRCEYTDHDFSIARMELLRTKNGAGLTIKIIKDDSLTKLVSYIGKALRVNGCINMEFIKQNGQYYLIDINPRFSAGVAFSHVGGYKMVQSHLNCFIGKDIYPPISVSEQIITKKHKEEVLFKTRKDDE
ncbi:MULTISPECIES: ATP-grasp domain-containing protein [Bacteroides]|uniref:ATP-grasp domain-containing protein n=1 Tax=Bacteroides TaxID=816 RepID=UPI0005AAEE62|nr:ATP-grasp domain-containing protein [Bacteroides neonati]